MRFLPPHADTHNLASGVTTVTLHILPYMLQDNAENK